MCFLFFPSISTPGNFVSHYHILHTREVGFCSLNSLLHIYHICVHTTDPDDSDITVCSWVNHMTLTRQGEAMGLFEIAKGPSSLVWDKQSEAQAKSELYHTQISHKCLFNPSFFLFYLPFVKDNDNSYHSKCMDCLQLLNLQIWIEKGYLHKMLYCHWWWRHGWTLRISY